MDVERINVQVLFKVKMAKKQPKMTIFQKWQMLKIKPKAIPSFGGGVGLIKVVSVFGFGRSKSHFWAPENGLFCRYII